MARSPRIDIVDGVHHVMNRGINHGNVFLSDNDRIDFGERLADVHARFGVVTLAYCLMDNHYHLVLRCPEAGLSAAMQSIGAVFTRHANDRVGRDGALFRGRFHSNLITDEAYLHAVVRYVHRNPLDRAEVTSPEDYRWSSHRAYLGHRRSPPWLDTDLVLHDWNGDRDAFGRFVADPVGTPTARPSADDVRAMVTMCEMLIAERLVGTQRRAGALARSIALSWGAESGVELQVLADTLGISTLRAAHVALSRARCRLREGDELSDIARRASELYDVRVARRRRSQLSSDPGCDQRAARAAS